MRIPRILAATLVISAPAAAQQAGVTMLPDTVLARIDHAFAAVGGPEMPGCAIGMTRDGSVVLTRAYGLANMESGTPNTPETIFESGSVAKQFTASAIVLLAQDGKLSLDDDVRKHLPELHDFGTKITIRNFLTHTSGIRDWYTLAALRGMAGGEHVHNFASILDLATHQKTLNFEPGAEYLYSNTGYILAALIVQRVSGTPFATFTQERLFKPIGMTHTQWRDDFTKVVKGRATAYTGNPRTGFTLDMPFTNVIGSGGLLTTVDDWLKWNAFLDNPTAIPGGASLVQAITTQMTLNNGKRIPYALGVSVASREGMKEVSHNGSTGGYRTWLARYPEEKASVAVLCNAGDAVNPTTLGQMSLLALLGKSPRPVQLAGVTHPPVETLKKYEGMYVGPNPEAIARFVVRDTQLVSVIPANRALTPLASDRFRAGAAEFVFEMSGDKVSRVVQVTGNDTTIFTPSVQFAPSPKDLAMYVGRFWNDETDAHLEAAMRDSSLVLHQRLGGEVVLRPMIPDVFASNAGAIEFLRDGRGNITGFAIWAGRARNIRFTRER